MEVIVPVRMTEEDVIASAGEFCDADEQLHHKKRKSNRIIIAVISAGYLLIMFSLWILSALFGRSNSVMKDIPFILLFVMNIFLFSYSVQAVKITRKTTIRSSLINFRKNCESRSLCTYTISDKGISVESRTQSSILYWEEVYYLIEHASCFTIQKSLTRKYVIPRRCFANDQQLREFRGIVSSNLPSSKWSLIGIPLSASRPDVKSADSSDDPVLLPDLNDCIYSVTFSISEKEAANLRFALYRSTSGFKKAAIFLVLLFAVLLWSYADNSLSLTVIIVAEIAIVIQIFALYRKIFLKSSKEDKTFWLEETVSFFPDRLVVETRSEHIEYFWNAVSRVKVTGSGLLIHPDETSAILIPASALNRLPNKNAFEAFLKSRQLAIYR